jgi:hypothetical protein
VGDDVVHMDEKLEGDGSDPGWRGVLLVVGAELTREPEVGLANAVVAGIRGPHAGKI